MNLMQTTDLILCFILFVLCFDIFLRHSPKVVVEKKDTVIKKKSDKIEHVSNLTKRRPIYTSDAGWFEIEKMEKNNDKF